MWSFFAAKICFLAHLKKGIVFKFLRFLTIEAGYPADFDEKYRDSGKKGFVFSFTYTLAQLRAGGFRGIL